MPHPEARLAIGCNPTGKRIIPWKRVWPQCPTCQGCQRGWLGAEEVVPVVSGRPFLSIPHPAPLVSLSDFRSDARMRKEAVCQGRDCNEPGVWRPSGNGQGLVPAAETQHAMWKDAAVYPPSDASAGLAIQPD